MLWGQKGLFLEEFFVSKLQFFQCVQLLPDFRLKKF